MRVEDAYLATLPPEEQSLAVAGNSMNAETAAVLATVPWPVLELGYAPYQWGPPTCRASTSARATTESTSCSRNRPPNGCCSPVAQPRGRRRYPVDAQRHRRFRRRLPALAAADRDPTARDARCLAAMGHGPRLARHLQPAAAYTTYRQGENGPLCMTAVAAVRRRSPTVRHRAPVVGRCLGFRPPSPRWWATRSLRGVRPRDGRGVTAHAGDQPEPGGAHRERRRSGGCRGRRSPQRRTVPVHRPGADRRPEHRAAAGEAGTCPEETAAVDGRAQQRAARLQPVTCNSSEVWIRPNSAQPVSPPPSTPARCRVAR